MGNHSKKQHPPGPGNLRRTLGYLRPYVRLQVAALVCAVFVTLLGLAFPWVLKILIDDVFANLKVDALGFVCMGLLGISLFSALLRVWRQYFYIKVGELATIDLRQDLLKHLQAQSLAYFSRQKVGRLMSYFTNDVQVLQQLYTSTLVEFITNSLRMVITLVVLFKIHPGLAWICLPSLALFALCVWAFKEPLRFEGRQVQERLAEVSDRLQEDLNGIREVKAFNRESDQAGVFARMLFDVLRWRVRQGLWGSASGGTAELISTAGIVAVLWVGGMSVIGGELTPGVLVAFVAYLGNLFGPTSWFVNLNVHLQSALAGAERIFALLDEQPDVQDSKGARDLPPIRGQVVFERVCYAYDAEEVLQDISFTVEAGRTVALVGPSGAGKTSLLNLIPRFADPAAGRILIDGYDLRNATSASLRRQIGLVSQDPFLFSAGVADNIRFGRPEATDAEVEAAARVARAHEFILALPRAYATTVGERGVQLSGGQRQRLSIARAILRSPAILLLDEATSALDSATEAAVQEALQRLMFGRTCFVIAHRLSTILHADCIFLLERGRLAAAGAHEQLLGSSVLYRNLYSASFHNQKLPASRARSAGLPVVKEPGRTLIKRP